MFSTAVLIAETEISKQILQIEQKLNKNPNWREANQLAIYKVRRSWIWDHQTQMHSVAGGRFEPQDLRITNPVPYLTTRPCRCLLLFREEAHTGRQDSREQQKSSLKMKTGAFFSSLFLRVHPILKYAFNWQLKIVTFCQEYPKKID